MDINHVDYFEKKYSPGFFYRKKWRKEIEELFTKYLLPNTSGKTIKSLDIGFKDTAELHALQEYTQSNSLVGIEIYQNKLKSIARELKEIREISVIKGDINDLEFEPEYFNYVFAFNSLYFAEDLEKVSNKLNSILVKKGKLAISLDIFEGSNDIRVKQYQKYNIKYTTFKKTEIIEALEKAGFVNIQNYKSIQDNLFIVAEKK